MEIYIGADHRGFVLKNQLREWLESKGFKVIDVGASELNDDDDYPDYAFKVAEAVAQDIQNRFGIGICGSGIGMAVAANKVAGVRAGFVNSPGVARAARHDDHLNVLALGADFVSLEQAQGIVQVCLDTETSEEARHLQRIDKISSYETQHNN